MIAVTLRTQLLAVGVLAVVSSSLLGAPALVPAPKEIRELGGVLRLQTPPQVEVQAVEGRSAAEVLRRAFGPPGSGTSILLRKSRGAARLGPEGYEIRVRKDGVQIDGGGSAGLFYGAHTLRQLAEVTEGKLPLCNIADWPAMQWRGVDYPVTRKEDLQRLAGLKLNLVVWEVSDQLRSTKRPEFAGNLRPSEMARICAEARRNHITLILETQSFGHAHWLLRPHPEFRANPQNTHTINPTAPGLYEVLSDVYGELIKASRVPFFFPGCDEPFDIDQWCQDKGLDPSQVVGEHLARLADLAKKHGARIMIWGDYLLKYPEALKHLDRKQVLIVDWHYNVADEYPSVDTFVRAGFETLVGPSVCPWEPLFPLYEVSARNIVNFVGEGHRRGAVGLLNTNWPTGPMPIEALWYGWAAGAEASWSDKKVDLSELDPRFFEWYTGDPSATVRERYFAWKNANAAWSFTEALTRPPAEILASRATEYAQPVIAESGAVSAMETVAELRRQTSAAFPPSGRRQHREGWRDLRSIMTCTDQAFYTRKRGALFVRAYDELYLAHKATDSKTRDQSLDTATACLCELATAASANDPQTNALCLKAMERVAEARRRGPFSPQQVLEAPTPPTHSGPAEVLPFQACTTVDPFQRYGVREEEKGGIIIPEKGTAVEIRFRVLEPGRYRVFALLRHSAGTWQNNVFVRGSRNAAYEGNYQFQLDGQPFRETWIGQELNPEEDEALQWAVLYEGDLSLGLHVLRLTPKVMNFAIVQRLLFSSDPAWLPPGAR